MGTEIQDAAYTLLSQLETPPELLALDYIRINYL